MTVGEGGAAEGVLPRRILVIGDERTCAGVRALLEDSDRTITCAGSLSDGLRQLSEVPAELVLASVTLPDCDSLTIFDRVRDAAPDVPIVALCTRAGERRGLEAVQSGADSHVAIDADEIPLVQAIRQATGRRAAAGHLGHMSHHDHLTGLVTASLFEDRFAHAIVRMARRDLQLALLLFDVVDLGAVNERFGHDTGDALLRSVAQRMRGVLRKVDTLARIRGDEFAVLAEDLRQPEDAEVVANKLRTTFGQPILIGDTSIEIELRGGIAVFPFDGTTPEALWTAAHGALRRAAEPGAPAFQMADPGLLADPGR